MPATRLRKVQPEKRAKALIDVNHLRIYEPRVADYIKRQAQDSMRSIHQQIVFMLTQVANGQ